MKSSLLIVSLFFALGYHIAKAQTQNVALNSLGFLPQQTKKASIVGESKSFVIKKISDQSVVFKGEASKPVFQKDVNQSVSIADFSSFTKNGKYYLETGEGTKSSEFEIGPKVFNQAFYTSMRGFYLWRCGTAVSGTHNGHQFAHDACHVNDGYEDFQGKPGVIRNGTGGWHGLSVVGAPERHRAGRRQDGGESLRLD